jgi:uncharacterized protein
LKTLLLAALLGYLGVAGLVWFAQDALMFFPIPGPSRASAPPGWRLEPVSLKMRDGTRIAGVLVLPPREKPALVIYFGGNAEEVTAYASQAAQVYGERALLLLNYRGYGESEGRPGENALVGDALEAFDWATQRPDLDTSRIVIHGRSLGSAVAVRVAAERAASCVILTSAFASAAEVAKAIYPWLPVSLMMRHPFDARPHAPKARMPALVLTGDADDIIPKRHSDELAKVWGGPVERASFEGFGHNDLHLHPGYERAIHAFLDRCVR